MKKKCIYGATKSLRNQTDWLCTPLLPSIVFSGILLTSHFTLSNVFISSYFIPPEKNLSTTQKCVIILTLTNNHNHHNIHITLHFIVFCLLLLYFVRSSSSECNMVFGKYRYWRVIRDTKRWNHRESFIISEYWSSAFKCSSSLCCK